MELIYISKTGDSYRLVYTSESKLRCIGRRSVSGRRNSCEKHWPRKTSLNLYFNETFIAETSAMRDSRDPDNKDYGMWVCTKKILTPENVRKEDRKAIWLEFFKSVNIFML